MSGGKADKKIVPLRKEKPCPMCAKPPADPFRPFCSKRCADLDLGRWLGEGYRVPGGPAPGERPPGEGESDDETP